MKEINLKTGKRNELVDITSQVKEAVEESGVREGLCVVYCPHTTAGITVNENADPDVKKDLLRKLSELAPEGDNYLHAEGNSDAHIKSSLVGNSSTIIIENGDLQLGTWGGIMFLEGDGPRSRKVLVKIIEG